MAKQYQGSPKWNTIIPDFPWRTNHREWSGIKRNKNCDTKQETRWHIKANTWRPDTEGLTKCKLKAKETVYWPGLNEHLEQLILNCQLCLKYSQSKHKQPPHMSLGWEIPIHRWTKLATDIFYFEGESYLLLVDYTSQFPIVHKLNSMTAQHVINHFKLIFSEYGWPDTLVSDNGPCYASEASSKSGKNIMWTT